VKKFTAALLRGGIAVALLSLRLVAQPSASPIAYQFPRASAVLVSPSTAIILRPGPLLDRESLDGARIVATGERSGEHRGRLVLSDDDRTLQFLPDVPFARGERVDVRLVAGVRTRDGAAVPVSAFGFTIDPYEAPVLDSDRLAAIARFYGVDPKRPTLAGGATSDVPSLTVRTRDNPAPGRLYLANLAFSTTNSTVPHLMIVDDDGVPVFTRRLGLPGFDFKRQPDGTLTYFSSEQGVFVVLDSTYTQIGTVYAVNGAQTDVHELLMLPNGHALVMGLVPRRADLRIVVAGGRENATVLDMVIQELDTARLPVFEWRSIDHFDITDAEHEDLTAETVDHVHPNSIELDADGNLLLSSRHLDEVTKISRTTGEIIWRLGGKHNQFTFTNDPERFSYQHDARRLGNGNLLLFDNGNHKATPYSRAVEYTLDETRMTATVAWQYRHTPDVYGYAMGNAQRLPNGNTLIGWGAYPLVTEVRPDGGVAFEMQLPPGVFTYRAFRLPAATSLVATSLVSPPSDSAGLGSFIDFTWARAGGATSYQLQVGLDSSFETIVLDHSEISGTSIRLGPFDPRVRHYWRVRPEGAEITGVWSNAWSFTTEAALALALVAPPPGATGIAMPPVLRWSDLPAIDTYNVQLSPDDLFFSNPAIDTVIEGNALWLDRGVAATRYYWRVRSVAGNGTGNWSTIGDYRTSAEMSETLPERIAPTLPADNAVLGPGRVHFGWEPYDGADALELYRLELDAGGRLEIAARDLEVPDGDIRVGTHRWRVRGTNARGEQYTSRVATFTLAATSSADAPHTGTTAPGVLVPNPASTATTIHCRVAGPTPATMRLLDVNGRVVMRADEQFPHAGDHAMTVRLDAVPSGIYLVTVTIGGETLVRRLVVAH
jgi:hypothetical protein